MDEPTKAADAPPVAGHAVGLGAHISNSWQPTARSSTRRSSSSSHCSLSCLAVLLPGGAACATLPVLLPQARTDAAAAAAAAAAATAAAALLRQRRHERRQRAAPRNSATTPRWRPATLSRLSALGARKSDQFDLLEQNWEKLVEYLGGTSGDQFSDHCRAARRRSRPAPADPRRAGDWSRGCRPPAVTPRAPPPHLGPPARPLHFSVEPQALQAPPPARRSAAAAIAAASAAAVLLARGAPTAFGDLDKTGDLLAELRACQHFVASPSCRQELPCPFGAPPVLGAQAHAAHEKDPRAGGNDNQGHNSPSTSTVSKLIAAWRVESPISFKDLENTDGPRGKAGQHELSTHSQRHISKPSSSRC